MHAVPTLVMLRVVSIEGGYLIAVPMLVMLRVVSIEGGYLITGYRGW